MMASTFHVSILGAVSDQVKMDLPHCVNDMSPTQTHVCNLLVFFCWLIHGLDKTLGPLSCIFYFILEWTVVGSSVVLKWRIEEKDRAKSIRLDRSNPLSDRSDSKCALVKWVVWSIGCSVWSIGQAAQIRKVSFSDCELFPFLDLVSQFESYLCFKSKARI